MDARASARSSRAAWKRARTYAELCELGARFVEGRIAFFPGWNAKEIDAESAEIAPLLARLCRAGFLTVASQPARARRGPDVQRAFVCGFAPRRLASALGRDLAPDLVLFRYARGWRAPSVDPEPVSLHDGIPHAFTGHDARAAERDCFEGFVTPEALAELQARAWVSLHDRRWGRKRALWKHVARVLDDEHA